MSVITYLLTKDDKFDVKYSFKLYDRIYWSWENIRSF